MSITIERYDEARDGDDWDALCAQAPMATLLHTRRFLAYHGQRFEDQSRVARDEQGHLLAVLPAARSPTDPRCVVSHPGATFGGLVHRGDLLGEDLLHVLADMAEDFARDGFASLRYKAVPGIYQRWPAQDDLYALFRLGARLYRRDLSSCIDLSARRSASSRRQSRLRRASQDVQLDCDATSLTEFWQLLTTTLARRHDAKPVHSLDEIRLLMTLFPQELQLVCGRVDGSIEAGVLLFQAPCLSHLQYVAYSETGNDCLALDVILEHCIERATLAQLRYFDFGMSNEDEGQVLNVGLYRFKSKFGGGGATHEFYELDLSPPAAQ